MSIIDRLYSNLGKKVLASYLKRHGMMYGAYDISNEVQLVMSTIRIGSGKRTPIVLDVGANKGEWSQMLVSKYQGKIAIECFEPSSDHSQRLKLLEREHHGRIFYYPYALSNEAGVMTLFKDQKGSSLASLYNRDIASHGLSLDLREEVRTITLDDWMREHSVPIINFLKLDCEGHELKVLFGAKRALSNAQICAIQFEFGGCNLDSRTFLKDFHRLLVRDHHFKLYRLAPSRSLVDLNSYHEGLENFSWQNLIAFQDMSLIPPQYKIVRT